MFFWSKSKKEGSKVACTSSEKELHSYIEEKNKKDDEVCDKIGISKGLIIAKCRYLSELVHNKYLVGSNVSDCDNYDEESEEIQKKMFGGILYPFWVEKLKNEGDMFENVHLKFNMGPISRGSSYAFCFSGEKSQFEVPLAFRDLRFLESKSILMRENPFIYEDNFCANAYEKTNLNPLELVLALNISSYDPSWSKEKIEELYIASKSE